MEKTLIIVRHGNTFLPEQTPTRVGGRTDLPLVEEKRGQSIGRYLVDNKIYPDKIYAAPLKRTNQTAQLIIDELQLPLEIIPEINFTEIDYGLDENKTEDEVEYRLGLEALNKESISPENLIRTDIQEEGQKIIERWNNEAIVPDGWILNTDKIRQSWKNFSENIDDNQTVLLCTSNGIIRFAPHILDIPYDTFCQKHDLKVATGSISIFKYINNKWECIEWNVKPYKLYE